MLIHDYEPEAQEVIAECIGCGEGICEGESYYEISNDIYCETCIDESRETA